MLCEETLERVQSKFDEIGSQVQSAAGKMMPIGETNEDMRRLASLDVLGRFVHGCIHHLIVPIAKIPESEYRASFKYSRENAISRLRKIRDEIDAILPPAGSP